MRRLTLLCACAMLAGAVVGCSDNNPPGGGGSTCSTVPPIPTGLKSGAVGTGFVALTWDANAPISSCSQKYHVLADGSVYALTTDTSLVVSGLEPGVEHSFSVSALDEYGASSVSPAITVKTPAVDFGPNTRIYDPSMATADIQADIDAVYAPQFSDVTGQFNTNRYALLFKPGRYSVKVPIGYYMQVLGLGALPDDVTMTGTVTSYGHWSGDWGGSGYNATQNFWRGVENFAVVPTNDTDPLPAGTPNTLGASGAPYMRWAVSQACPFRRMHVRGDIALNHWSGWASGGWMSDSKIDGEVGSGSQQQWITRNSLIGSWSNVNWNMVFMGVDHPFTDLFEKGWNAVRTTIFETTPMVREKPFLTFDETAGYRVFVPALREGTTGTTWAPGRQSPGTAVSIRDFYIAVAPAAGTQFDVTPVNAALALGKHVLFAPGIYHLTDTVRVTQPDSIVLGLGMATLHPDTGLPAMTIADVDGVTVAGLLFDAGTQSSPVLLQVGEEGASADHSANPTVLTDVFMRVGGAEDGKADVGMIINSKNVIGDHFWIWRADHGTAEAPTGWTLNPSRNGLVVNGDDVTIYGLFVEHFEEYQTLWNGQGGRVYFYQSEIPYDVPSQDVWMSHGGAKNGWASYKVADGVTDHEAWGLGVYSVFNIIDGVLDSSIEVPAADGVKMHHMVNFGLSKGTITHVINDVGGPAANGPWATNGAPVAEYPVPVVPPLPDPAALVFPLNFDATPNARYDFASWGAGLQFGVITDPDNAANKVLGFLKKGGDAWAGFSFDGGDTSHWLAANPFDTSKQFTLRVKCDTANVPFLLKFENPANGSQSVQKAATSAAAGTWQTLTFDLGAETIVAGVPYTKADLFPGYDGSAGKDAFCYVDDLVQVAP